MAILLIYRALNRPGPRGFSATTREEPPRTSASHRKSHVLPAPQRIEELLHGHDCDSVDTPRAGLKAHGDMTLEHPPVDKGPQRARGPGRDGVLVRHLEPGAWAQYVRYG